MIVKKATVFGTAMGCISHGARILPPRWLGGSARQHSLIHGRPFICTPEALRFRTAGAYFVSVSRQIKEEFKVSSKTQSPPPKGNGDTLPPSRPPF